MRNALHKTLEAFAAIWYRTDRYRGIYYLCAADIGENEDELEGKTIKVTIEIKDEDGEKPLANFLKKEEGKVFADYLEKSGLTIT